jgi:Tfp pilus assembly protein PilW
MMPTVASERGFTLVELLISTLVSITVLGIAVGTFSNAMSLKDTAMQVADASQNLRGGSNLLVRDLLQVGRNLPRGGIAIPSGAGSSAIRRPGPPDEAYTFDEDAVVLSALTTGEAMGATINGSETDMITLITEDPYLAPLTLFPSTTPGTSAAKIAADGTSFNVGSNTVWLNGDPENGIAPIKAGDLIYFQATSNTLQTVTSVSGKTVYFASNDPFNLNQPGAEAGSITEVIGAWQVTARRVFMYTYYVYEDVPGIPRLMRQFNFFPPQALAGVIEDLDLSYDLVDGTYNPVNVKSLPYDANNMTYTENQIRKVNIHIGVRSEFKSVKHDDYLRNHVSTVISLRNLAYVSRYE